MSYGLLDYTLSRYGLYDFQNVDSGQVYAAHKQLQEAGEPLTLRNYLTELLKTHTGRTIGYQRGEAGDVYRISRGTRTTSYDAHDRPLEFIDFLDPYLRAPANKLPELKGWYTESGRYVLEAGEVDGEPYIISMYETPFDWDR
jgi:hypothetical protein|nr:MAG TPA: hypothetical protein [Caudoviricetes sp.]